MEEAVDAVQYLENLNKALDDYSKSVGLGLLKAPQEVDVILNLDIGSLRILSAEDCSYFSTALALYATFLKKEENRHFAKAKWADDQIDIYIAKNISGQGDTYKNYQEKRMIAIRENSFTFKLNQLRAQAYSRFNEIKGMSDKVETVAEYIKNLSFTKRKNESSS